MDRVLLYITVAVVSHCRSVYLKRKEHSEELKIEKEKCFSQKLRNELLLEEVYVAKAGISKSKLDTDFS